MILELIKRWFSPAPPEPEPTGQIKLTGLVFDKTANRYRFRPTDVGCCQSYHEDLDEYGYRMCASREREGYPEFMDVETCCRVSTAAEKCDWLQVLLAKLYTRNRLLSGPEGK